MSFAQDPARPRPRLVIVDADHRVRASLASLIASDGRIDVVGVAGHVGAALEAIEEGDADVVVVDPRLPEADAGLAMLREIRRRWAACTIVILSWSDPLSSWPLAPGVDRFVGKSASPGELIEAILDAATCGTAPSAPTGPSAPADPGASTAVAPAPRRADRRSETPERVG